MDSLLLKHETVHGTSLPMASPQVDYYNEVSCSKEFRCYDYVSFLKLMLREI